jgi:hypothetical protein
VSAASGVALAQTTTPPSSTSSKVDDVSKWTSKQWDRAKAKWVEQKEKWADCQKQSEDQKIDGSKELVIPRVLHDARINGVQDRRCLPMDITAMESCKGQVGKRNRKMGRLSEAVEGSKFDLPEELVVSRVLHDWLALVSLKRPGSASNGMSKLPAHPDLTDGAGGFLPGVPLGCLGMGSPLVRPVSNFTLESNAGDIGVFLVAHPYYGWT